MRTAVAAIVLISGLLARSSPADTVERRGSEAPLEGVVQSIDDAGVTIRSEGGGTHFVAWDRVRTVHSERFRGEIDKFAASAAVLWRARTRLERGDAVLAAPLFERLFETYRGRTHETALVVAEGLLRCRLDSGDRLLAVLPALETARLRRAGVTTTSYSVLSPVIDPATSLCPQLPPIWAPAPALARLEAELARYDPMGDVVVAALRDLYAIAARQLRDSAAAGPQPAANLPRQEGVELLDQLVRCASANAEGRRAAIEQLERRLGSLPPWAEAWARYQIGAALLRDGATSEQRHRGMLSLLHLPARFARTQPNLAALALITVADALDQDGRREAAESLRAELRQNYPRWAAAAGRRPSSTTTGDHG